MADTIFSEMKYYIHYFYRSSMTDRKTVNLENQGPSSFRQLSVIGVYFP